MGKIDLFNKNQIEELEAENARLKAEKEDKGRKLGELQESYNVLSFKYTETLISLDTLRKTHESFREKAGHLYNRYKENQEELLSLKSLYKETQNELAGMRAKIETLSGCLQASQSDLETERHKFHGERNQMGRRPILDDKTEQELLSKLEEGWSPQELSLYYKISDRTLRRIFQKHDVHLPRKRRAET